MGPAALIGIASLAALIVGIGGLIVGIGALFDKFPMLEEFLNKGIPILQKIGEGIGKFFGGIVGGFMEGVADSLPHLGEQLSLFMEKVQPFVDSASKIDGGALITGIGAIAGAVLALTAADFLTGLSALIGGGVPFEGTALCLSNFANKLQPFLDKVKDIDSDVVDTVKSLAEAILIITAADLLNGITSFFAGESSLANFAAQLPLLGTGIKGLIDNIGDADVSKVAPVADAVKALAGAANEIPNAGGLLAQLVGDNELGTFAEQFPCVGTGIKGLVDNLDGVNMDAVGPAAEAVATFAKVANDIPNTGGLLASLVGDNTLSDFAAQLPEVGTGLSGFITNLGSTNLDSVKPAASALAEFITIADSIPNTGGLVSWFTGDNDLGVFAAKIPDIGTNLADFVTNLGGTDLQKVTSACECLKAFIEAANTIPNSGGVISWFTGDNDLADFGEDMADLGGYMYDFYSEVCLVDTMKLKNSADALQQIVNVAKATNGLSTTGVDTLKSAFDKFDEMKISEFKEKFAEGLTATINRVKQIAEDLAGVSKYADKSGIETLRSAIAIANAMDIKKLKESFADSLSTYTDRIQKLAKGISGLKDISIDNAATRNLNTAVSTLAGMSVQQMIETFNGSVDDAVSDMETLVRGINKLVDLDTSGTESFKSAVTTLAETGVSKLIETFNGSADDLEMSGAKMVKNVVSGLKSNEKDIGTSLSGGVASAVQGAKNYYSDFYSAGSYLATGFANGITANSYAAAAQARAMAKAAVLAAEEALGIASPSKVFGEIGNFAGLGFVNKLREYDDKAYDASAEMADSARSGLKDSINKVLGLINGTMDAQPTIRPVLDLSGVESGVGAIGRMFNTEASIGVTSNLRAIDSSMSHYGQNGANDDVIRAINKLGSKLDNAGGTTNYINGISYDDGSNISSAVETLVRAARIERRS